MKNFTSNHKAILNVKLKVDMKRILIISFVCFLSLMAAACNGVRREDVGLVGGAVAGGLIGSAVTGKSTVGTVVGAAAGAVGGRAIARSTR